MTRKDYVAIANAMKETKPEGINRNCLASLLQWKKTADNLAEILELDNPRFDRDRLLIACGMEAAK